jgi:hypothetical protein
MSCAVLVILPHQASNPRSVGDKVARSAHNRPHPQSDFGFSGSLKRAAESAGHGDEDASSDKTGDQIADPTAAERDAEESP